jgi:hypothetical protein
VAETERISAEAVLEPVASLPVPAEVPPDAAGLAVFSVGLGLLGMVAWLLPIIGIPMTATGLVLGWRALGTPRRALAIAGMSLCVVFLVLAVMNGGANVYVSVTGRQLVDPRVLRALLRK